MLLHVLTTYSERSICRATWCVDQLEVFMPIMKSLSNSLNSSSSNRIGDAGHRANAHLRSQSDGELCHSSAAVIVKQRTSPDDRSPSSVSIAIRHTDV
ncbi:hypothetical protein HNY73_011917 [Argiope bruennichi]|uniref:Uncharacterized protein n=1 Tax=Argiope bruennichi TaxID=94029 RepID=A0A8T0EXR6_ARGBR|nr:hypothetical protein HNY73_011917 [Argiope bruennichi]